MKSPTNFTVPSYPLTYVCGVIEIRFVALFKN